MPLPQWSRLFSRRLRPMSDAKVPKTPACPTMQVERLEDRSVPAIYTWTGATSNNWLTSGNWSISGVDSGGLAGIPDTAGDSAVFDGTGSIANNVPNITSAIATDGITFTGGATSFAITGSKITLGTSGLTLQGGSAAAII